MDPLSIISLAGAATQATYNVSVQIYNFINTAKDIDELVTTFATELSSLTRSLDAIQMVLQNPLVKTERATAPENAPVWAALAGSLYDCRKSLDNFDKQIQPLKNEGGRKYLMRKALTTVKLNVRADDMRRMRAQVHSHTMGLQVSLQIVNVLVAGLSPINAVETMSKRMEDLTDGLAKLRSDSQVQERLPHYGELDSLADSLVSRAPEYVTTGLLSSVGEQDVEKSRKALKEIVSNHNKSLLRVEVSAVDDDTSNADDRTMSDSDEGNLKMRVANKILAEAQAFFDNKRWSQASKAYRDGLRQLAGAVNASDESVAEKARLNLALSCFYDEKLEEAEMMFLMLAKADDQITPTAWQAHRHLTRLYLCRYDFESALEHCTTAVRFSRRLYGREDRRHLITVRLLALVYEANGDFLTADEYAAKAPNLGNSYDENETVVNKFSGFSREPHLRMALLEKKLALTEMSGADIIKRPTHAVSVNTTDKKSQALAYDPAKDALSMPRALSWAAGENQVWAAKWLLARGVSVRGTFDRAAPLILAAEKGCAPVVKLLLECGADTDTRDRSDNTAMHWAALWGHESTVRLLVDAGANVNATDSDGCTPIGEAAVKGNISIIDMLVDAGARLDIRNRRGNTPVSQAFMNNEMDSVRALIEHGSPVNDRDHEDVPILCEAASRGNVSLVRLMLDRGAEVDVRTGNGNTALLMSANTTRFRITELLLEYGADVNAMNNDQYTGFLKAVDSDNVRAQRLLLEHGADPNKGRYSGWTAGALARHRRNWDTIKFLNLERTDIKYCYDFGEQCEKCELWRDKKDFK